MDIKKKYIGVLYIILITGLLPVFASKQHDFPVPEQLEPNIEFWVRIFAIYSENQVVIHDSYYPEIVYEIVNLDDFFQPNTSLRVQWKKVNKIIDGYQNILKKFSKMETIDLDELTDKERHVYLLWIDIDAPEKFKKAVYSVRGQRGLKEDFKNGLVRSGKYLPEFQEIFRKYDLPVELCYLPHIESSFVNRAHSKVGASGLWQFMRSTGRSYLNINRYEDERLDPFQASDAAARLLKNNYQILGSWPLAITAYNHGPNGLLRAKRKLKTDDFGVIVEKYKSRSFGFASRNFYAEFLAAVLVRRNYQNFFGQLDFEKPDAFTLFTLPESESLNNICIKLRVPKTQLLAMNPGLQSRVISSRVNLPKNFQLRIPLKQNIDPYLLYAGVYNTTSPDLSLWVLDTDFNTYISDLHTAFSSASTKVQFISEFNLAAHEYVSEFKTEHWLNPYNPVHEQGGETTVSGSAQVKTPVKVADNRINDKSQTANVQTGNSQTMLASANPVAVDTLINYLDHTPFGPSAPDSLLKEKIIVQIDELMEKMDFSVKETRYITVLPNETLGHYADWLQVSTQSLRRLNRLSYNRSIHIGQKLKVTFTHQTVDNFIEKRTQYHMDLRQDFYSDFSIVGTKLYTIKHGDNIWYLCKNIFHVPYWLVANYNLGILLNVVKPGDEIRIPIISPFAQNKNYDYQG